MSKLTLDKEIYRAIVDGTLKGYLQYLDERTEKQITMNVSGAYAWTRGNHIDDQVSRIAQEKGLTFKIEKAGYTWEYLQFTVNENNEEYMLIVKNARRVKKSLNEQKSQRNEENYLSEFAKYNIPLIHKSDTNYVEQTEQMELELNDPDELKAFIDGTALKTERKYARFYIITYEIDDATKFISSIKLTMPNPYTMNLEEIDDLNSFMEDSEYEITVEDVEPIKAEDLSDQTIFSGSRDSFGYAIPSKEDTGN